MLLNPEPHRHFRKTWQRHLMEDFAEVRFETRLRNCLKAIRQNLEAFGLLPKTIKASKTLHMLGVLLAILFRLKQQPYKTDLRARHTTLRVAAGIDPGTLGRFRVEPGSQALECCGLRARLLGFGLGIKALLGLTVKEI